MAARSYDRSDLQGVFGELKPFYGVALTAGSVPNVDGVTERVTEAATAQFERLAPEIPFIGPLDYALPRTLVESGVALSFYRALKVEGWSVDAAGKVIVAAFEASLRAVPEDELRRQGEAQFGEEAYRMQALFALESQKQRCHGDWVYEFIKGDACDFDWGYDFTECGILKFFDAQGALELMPFLCVQDFIVSRKQATGLVRTKTLADGGDRCDFRYKKGRPI